MNYPSYIIKKLKWAPINNDKIVPDMWPGGEVVTLRSAKPPCEGSIPSPASNKVSLT